MNKINKKICVVSCPIDVWSGYGKRSVDFVKSLIHTKGDEWDIKILSQPWGSCARGYLEKHDENDLISRIIPTLIEKPNIWFQITVPNEFQQVGDYNIGVTAGIETTLCDSSWIEGLNRMDLTLVSSKHAKLVFEQTKFEKRHTQSGQLESIIELKKPVEVLFEGIDVDVYKPTKKFENEDLFTKLDSIPEKYNFLFVGHWLKGNLGNDRKDVGMLIKTHLETFKNKPVKPGLILKTSGLGNGILDRDTISRKIIEIKKLVGGDLPNVYLLHGEFSDKEMNEIYNHPKVGSLISFTKGEGFGRPLLEFSLVQKPVITSGYSGHLDFLDPNMAVLLEGSVNPIDSSSVWEGVLIPESSWFTVDYMKASAFMVDVYKNNKIYIERAKRQAYVSRTKFNWNKMGELLLELLNQYVKLPEEIKLPTLKRIK